MDPIVHQDTHVEADYDHITLVTNDAVATFHRHDSEDIATVLPSNVTMRDDNVDVKDHIDDIAEAAQGRIATVIKIGVPLVHAVRWGCADCGEVFEATDDAPGRPRECPSCSQLLVREGSSFWTRNGILPDGRVYNEVPSFDETEKDGLPSEAGAKA